MVAAPPSWGAGKNPPPPGVRGVGAGEVADAEVARPDDPEHLLDPELGEHLSDRRRDLHGRLSARRGRAPARGYRSHGRSAAGSRSAPRRWAATGRDCAAG